MDGNQQLLQEMDAQHGQQRKKWSACANFWVVGRNEFNQSSPRHYLVHLLQEHLLVGFLDAEIEIQGGLFQATYFLRLALPLAHGAGSHAEFP